MDEPIYKGNPSLLSDEEKADIMASPQPGPTVFVWKDECTAIASLFTCRVTAAINLYIVSLPNHPWSCCFVTGVAHKRVVTICDNVGEKRDAQKVLENYVKAMEGEAKV